MTTSFRRPSLRPRLLMLCGLLLCLPPVAAAQESAESAVEAEVRAVVERFLDAVGRQDLDALSAMFAPGASIAAASLRDGRWVTRSQSFDDWLSGLRAAGPGTPYREPVNEFHVHVDDGQLAFVRADARLIRDGTVRSHNIDYFTLIRDSDGQWKFVNGSYKAKPAN